MEMTQVGTLTLTQIWLTTMILAVMPMDLTPLIQVILLPMVTIQTPKVVADLEYNGAGSQFDGDGGGGGADLGVFNFCEGEDQPHATAHVSPVDDEPRDAPSIETFSVAEDLRQARHADSIVATNPTIDAVEVSHSASDSLDFGDVGEGGNIHQECNPSIVEPLDQINAPSRAASPSVPLNTLMAPLPSRLQHTPGLCIIPSPNRPLTCSVANQRGIGHTLLMARVVPRNSNHTLTCPRPSSETVSNNMGTVLEMHK